MTHQLIIWTIAVTLYCEARGEGIDGMRMVASVIWNRYQQVPVAVRTVKDLSNVCRKPWQFSCWNPGGPALEMYAHLEGRLYVRPEGEDGKAWVIANAIAHQMIEHRFKPVTTATHYHAVGITPAWVHGESMQYVEGMGRHVFYKEQR